MKSLPCIALLSCAGLLFAQSAAEPKFSELTRKDRERLAEQRAFVAAAARQRYGTAALTGTKKDLPILQRLLDDKAFTKSQRYELQSLGVAFGDVLTSELPLRWVMITDEYGTDPTLRFRETNTNINALTMISKRVERGERVDVFGLLRKIREALADARTRQETDLDQSVLVQLRKSGSNLSKPHKIEFFLYFPTQSIAKKASINIRDAGFEVEVRRAAQGDSWLCFATKTMIPALPDLQRIRQNFMALSVSMNGEYDGWGTQIVK